ncbi:CoB--CoM heterodisulfide reductase iron-sulfur subunit A family protein [Desulfoferrobacter suflitae]|uniref:CoB--CoM heterodisulfide reductase iron-sulfur subunit A family protein n=1 Tax=Desulfoferrobacter suflitae TaxID=2865782 RepID=UPI0021648048|nr:CoB--CoM heterodisulfide reductase iron-sulfur subunit A family protein [Desulfoferrobacter suflitae]MCK8602945.1 CoB--CoM heterodisulfide reductase iron-sulfur subunit A family protein [Desulfoferrobacter suflitae]
MAEEIRIGVFVCDCGSNIAGYLKVSELAEYAKTLPNVVYVKENLYTCSESGINEIKAAVKEQDLNRVVVASCTPRTHEPLFRETCAEGGLNPYLFEMVNIRDQCSWVHMQEKEEGTAKAKDLIRMGVAKASLLQPQEPIESPMDPRAMVIGGGISGMTSALALANRGYQVTLVEKAAELGGLLLQLDKIGPANADAASVAEKHAQQVQGHPKIKTLTATKIDAINGYIGNFKVTTSTNGVQEEFGVGVIVVATGARVLKPVGLFNYDGEKVITQLELESLFKKGAFNAKNVVMIQCVGARNEERKYCSRICCMVAIKNAIAIKERSPDTGVHILYRDIQAYGTENEELYQYAKQLGVRFLKYDQAKPPKVEEGRVTVYHHLLGRDLELPVDLVVLSTPLIAGEDNETISRLLRVSLDENKFFLEGHVKLKPLDFANDGIYLCGNAHYPATVREAISQALGAASRASIPLSRDVMTVEPIVSTLVDEDACRGCGLCVALCPYGALEIVRTEKGRKVKVIPVACKGCGVCAATCYQHALTINSYTDEQIGQQIEAFLETGTEG